MLLCADIDRNSIILDLIKDLDWDFHKAKSLEPLSPGNQKVVVDRAETLEESRRRVTDTVLKSEEKSCSSKLFPSLPGG